MEGRCPDHADLVHILLVNNHKGSQKARSPHTTMTTTIWLYLNLKALELLCCRRGTHTEADGWH